MAFNDRVIRERIKSAYPHLDSLFSAYLMQDYELHGPTWEAVVDVFAEQSGAGSATVKEIGHLMSQTTDDEIEAILGVICELDPSSYGMSYLQFLRAIARRLSAE